jgi:phospholipid/cholesterol/gamma-HCH transport system substrate-binding protein
VSATPVGDPGPSGPTGGLGARVAGAFGGLSRAARTALVVLVVAALVLAVVVLRTGAEVTRVTAHFTRAVGVYEGSDVRMLGVRIGTITRVQPEGETVRVELEYDADRKVPADAIAVVVAPSVVSDRYVQLAPVYRGGAALADRADIPISRTATPVELDEVYRALNVLSVALGPRGANKDGALSRLVDVGAANLEGTGAEIGRSLSDASRAVQTLSEGRRDLVGVIRNLQVFTTALARNDAQVRRFNSLLATVAAQLAGERVALGAALSNLATALGDVARFVRQNREVLRRNVSGLAAVTSVLVHQQAALAEFLDVAPTALSNLDNAYNPSSGTLDTRNQLSKLAVPAVLCSLLAAGGKLPVLPPLQRQFCEAVNGRGLPTIPGLPPGPTPPPGGPAPTVPVPGAVPPVPIPSVPELPGVPSAPPAPAPPAPPSGPSLTTPSIPGLP